MALDFQLPDQACTERVMVDGVVTMHWRPLRLTQPRQKGWDVFSIQTGLEGLEHDGTYGPSTNRAVREFQEKVGLEVDGICGGDTQRGITNQIARRFGGEFALPRGLMKSQLEWESSRLPPNFSAKRSDGSRDCGVAERNDQYTPQAEGFNTFESVRELARNCASFFEKYRDWGVTERRAWELAAGAWNAWAWTDRLARGQSLSPAQQAHIDSYIANATASVHW